MQLASGFLVHNQEGVINGLIYQQVRSCIKNMEVSCFLGPLKYGPIVAGAGQVMDHSFPVLEAYPPKQRNKALVPDLAAMIDSAIQVNS